MIANGRVELGRRGRLVLVLPVVMVAAMVGVSLLTADDDGEVSASASSGPVARASPTSAPGPTRCPGDDAVPIPPWPPRVSVLGPFVLTVPAGGDWCRLVSDPDVWAAGRDSWRPGDVIGFAVAGAIPCVDGEPLILDDGRPPPERIETSVDGYAAERFHFRPGSACHPNEVLDALHAPGGRGAVDLTLWTVHVGGSRVAMWAMTGSSTSPRRDAMVRVIESVVIDPDPRDPLEPFPDGPTFPPAGELEAGRSYWASVDSHPLRPGCCDGGFAFSFGVRSAGWISSGPASDGHAGAISKGTVGSADWAVIRFSNPDRVATDPCAMDFGPQIGESVDELAAAIEAIPGLAAQRPSDVRLRWSTARQLVLTLPGEPGCAPGEFALWWDQDTGPRFAIAQGAPIRLWIFSPNDRPGFGRIVVEAETSPAASPELQREIERIVGSISHGG